ncbi:hypothetical protein [Nocardia sp. MW-W600-9]
MLLFADEGTTVAVSTAGPGEVVNQDMADRLRRADTQVVAEYVDHRVVERSGHGHPAR